MNALLPVAIKGAGNAGGMLTPFSGDWNPADCWKLN
jgi:hypothetical protein